MASVITSIGAVGGCWHLGDGSRPGEEPPIGLILCGEMKREQIALLQLDRGEIRVEYMVDLPSRESWMSSWDIGCPNSSSGIRSSRVP